MIQIRLAQDSQGFLRRLSVSGHGGFLFAGQDVVCAGVSILVRTFVRTLESDSGVVFQAWAPQPGLLDVKVDVWGAEVAGWFKGVSDACLMGLADMAEEFPAHVQIKVEYFSED